MSKFERESKISVTPNYIIIKKSKIPKAGKGAFVARDIPEGITIGEYLGEVYTGKEMQNTDGDYLFSVRKNGKEVKIIDGQNPEKSSWVRFVNTTLENGDGNARFFQYKQRIFIRTIKKIKKGEEIYAYYGDDYVNTKIKG
jgi:SET domain-containing protein